jgi:thiol:disulfide interchange protein DsbD
MKYLKLIFLLTFFVQSQTEPINTGHAEVSLIKGSYANNQLVIGIKMDMQDNWHTYWKNPGDSGGPIKVEWAHEDNISKISEVLWPAPELIPYPPLMTYGYENFVIFPFYISPAEINTEGFQWCGADIENCFDKENFEINADVEANIDFLICADICVPEKAYIKTSIQEMSQDSRLDDWLDQVPSITLPTLIKKDKQFLEIRFSFNYEIENIYFYIEQKGVVLHSGNQILTKEENNWLLKVPTEKNIDTIETVNGVLNIDGKNYLISSQLNIKESKSLEITFLQAVIFAFIGGLILNLMPCVFPIISLKILSFVSMGNESNLKIRQHALSFCLGVLVTFLLIGLAMIMLKQAGSYLGWGFQLQSPVIVSILSMIMFVIGVVLLTDINIGSSLTKLGGVGSNSIFGSFLTGVLAVIVASPCTAPFMGAALGYALIQPSGTTLPVFASLGIGFAVPYLILAIYPNLINSLPKPGKWMETLKQFFAFPMFATSLWLIWIFSLQTSVDTLINLLIVILVISLLMWMLTIFKSQALKLILWISILFVIVFQGIKYDSINVNKIDVVSDNQKYSEFNAWNSNIEQSFKNKRQAYLINFTAAWCITCQANDKIALSRPKIRKYMKDNDIEYIVADWTNKNTDILNALESYNRNGVPLYVFWKPGMNESMILPAILTEQILLDSFENDIIESIN